MINITTTSTNSLATVNQLYDPLQITQQCANWCVEQQIVHFNNAEVGVFVVVALAYLVLLVEEWGKDIRALNFLVGKANFIVRLLLLAAILGWLIMFKYRMIPLAI